MSAIEHTLPENRFALPVVEAASALGVSRRTISRLLASGALQGRKLGRRTLIDAASLRTYYASLPTTH